jgi:hypothetical protein
LCVDFLLPTYQKNDFSRSDNSWAQTVEAICGVGPFLPKSRKALGFPEQNTSPLGTLVNAFRRIDKGTKCLFAPNDVAKSYAIQFRKGARDYIDDTLWWKAAQEEDQKQNTGGARSTAVNTGETPSDDISSYLGITEAAVPVSPPLSNAESAVTASTITSNEIDTPVSMGVSSPVSETSNMDELILRSTLVNQLSGKNYKFGNTAPLNVRVYELNKGEILAHGETKPCFF